MVCPNCGAQLPDTAVLCYSCRTQFDHSTHKYYPPDVAKYFPKDANKNINTENHTDKLKGNPLPSNSQVNPQQQEINQLRQHIQHQQRQIEQMNNSSNNALYYSGLITGILAGIFVLISVFLPFITASAFGISQSASLSQKSMMYVVLAVVFCLVIIVNSVSMHGTANIVVGIILLVAAFYMQSQVTANLEDSDIAGLTQMGIGFYTLIISSVITIVSGILLVIHNNQE